MAGAEVVGQLWVATASLVQHMDLVRDKVPILVGRKVHEVVVPMSVDGDFVQMAIHFSASTTRTGPAGSTGSIGNRPHVRSEFMVKMGYRLTPSESVKPGQNRSDWNPLAGATVPPFVRVCELKVGVWVAAAHAAVAPLLQQLLPPPCCKQQCNNNKLLCVVAAATTSDSRTTPNESQSVSGSGVGQPSQTNPRQKKDIAWKHVTESTSSEGRKILTCDYCHTSFRGGGINRMKQHLAGEKENVASCKKVPPKIRFMIQGFLKENVERAKEKRGFSGINEYAFGASAHEFSYDDYTAYAKKESHKQQPESSKKKAKRDWSHYSKSVLVIHLNLLSKIPYKVKKNGMILIWL
ncbi:hypothetical protein Sango_2592800 [Sesamum angolense]|uniref:BED-type domain-containing protein n=1 Tax=Sesamum angolense TaxID=2727404 RepID=A0AAE1W5Q5_9LAMI|nr:hypothetical protein Sango_2592800 [Sesamum angolense]